MSFASLLDGFKGFFSRTFWFGSFLPVAIVAAAHLGLACWLLGRPTAEQIGTIIGTDPGMAVLLLAGLIILAYALAPITPMFNGLFDGSLLPGWLHDRLRRDRAGEWREQVALYRSAQIAYASAADPGFVDELRAAVNGPATSPVPDTKVVRAAIEEAEALLKAIEESADQSWNKSLEPSRPIDMTRLAAARSRLMAASFADVAMLDPPGTAGPWRNRAGAALRKIFALRREAIAEARHKLNAIARRMPNLDAHDWQATRLGDARYARDRYVRDTYGVSFDFLWPKLRLAIGDGEADDSKGVPKSVADAAALVDFAALLLTLCITVPLVWLPILLLSDKPAIAVGQPVAAFLAIGLAAPLFIAACYELLVRSEMAFGSVVQTMVDRYHLAVFPLLSLPVPATLSAERELWSRIEQSSWSGANVELVYKPVPATV